MRAKLARISRIISHERSPDPIPEALRIPTPPWTPTLPRQMMCATPIVGAVMDIVVWLRSLVLGSTRRSSAYQWMGVARHDQNWLENGRKNDG
jgi:hypothetical protein